MSELLFLLLCRDVLFEVIGSVGVTRGPVVDDHDVPLGVQHLRLGHSYFGGTLPNHLRESFRA